MYIVRFWSHDKIYQVEELEVQRAITNGDVVRMFWDGGGELAIPIHRLIDISWHPKEEF